MAYRIDLTPNASYTETVSVSQDDVGREIVIDLYKDGTAYTPASGTTIVMQGTKPSGLGYTITGTASESSVTFLTTEEMTQEFGRFASELVLTNGTTVIGTANFALYVEKNPHPANSTDGTLETIPALEERIEALEQGGGGGLTDGVKAALLQIAQKVAYVDEHGQDYYDDLYDALYAVTAISVSPTTVTLQTIGGTQQLTATTTPSGATVIWASSNTAVATVDANGLVTSVGYGSATITATAGQLSATCAVIVAQATVTSIDAVYTQSGTVYDSDSLDSLKDDLVVTAHWSNSTTTTVAGEDYTLSGTLEVGTSLITVSYGGKTATFNVTVSSEEWTVVKNIGSDITTGCLVLTDGSTNSSTDWYTSDYIEVPEGATSFYRTTSRTSDYYLCWYDSEKAYLGNGLHGTYSGNAQYGGGYTDDGQVWNVVPITAKYARVSWRTSATYTSLTFKHNPLFDQNRTPLVDKIYHMEYDPESTSTFNSPYLKCAGMAYAQIRPVMRRSVTFYDADFIQVSQIATANNIGNNVTIPSDAVYLKCGVTNIKSLSNGNTTIVGQRLIQFTDTTKESW